MSLSLWRSIARRSYLQRIGSCSFIALDHYNLIHDANGNYLASDSTCEEAGKRVDEDVKLRILREAQCESEGAESIVN